MKEKDLFPPLKKHFKDKGYSVFAEVPCFNRGIDVVAVKGDDHIAIEMKLSFNDKVFQQAREAKISFGKSYIAYPVKRLVNFEDGDVYWKQRENMRRRIEWCRKQGIGIFQIVLPHMIVVEMMESIYEKPYRIFDFSMYKESDTDEAGLPYQKGVSAGYMELQAIKEYVVKNPNATWKEIYTNVQNHYSNHNSLAGSMAQWRGFSLPEFKKSLT